MKQKPSSTRSRTALTKLSVTYLLLLQPTSTCCFQEKLFSHESHTEETEYLII